jgi:hypothetical protein
MEEITRQESSNLVPIGRVIDSVEYPNHVKWESITSKVVIAPQLVEALDGIDGFSHVLIIFYLHKVDEDRRSVLKVHPENKAASILPEPLKPGIITCTRGGEAVKCESEILCPAMLTSWWRS